MDFYLQLLGEVVSDDGGEGGEEGSEKHTDVSDVYGDVKKVEDVVEDGRRNHESWRKK